MNGLKMLAIWTAFAIAIGLTAEWSLAAGWMNANSGVASWVQAIGSVAAIVATGWGVLHAHALQERARRREKLRDELTRTEAIFVEMKDMEYMVELSCANLSGCLPTFEEALPAIRDCIARVERYDLFAFPSHALVRPFAETLMAVKHCRSLMEEQEHLPAELIPTFRETKLPYVEECWNDAKKAVATVESILWDTRGAVT